MRIDIRSTDNGFLLTVTESFLITKKKGQFKRQKRHFQKYDKLCEYISNHKNMLNEKDMD